MIKGWEHSLVWCCCHRKCQNNVKKLSKICKRVRRRRQDVAESKDVIGPACLVDSLTVIWPLQVVRLRMSHTFPGNVWFIRSLRENNFNSLGEATAPLSPLQMTSLRRIRLSNLPFSMTLNGPNPDFKDIIRRLILWNPLCARQSWSKFHKGNAATHRCKVVV